MAAAKPPDAVEERAASLEGGAREQLRGRNRVGRGAAREEPEQVSQLRGEHESGAPSREEERRRTELVDRADALCRLRVPHNDDERPTETCEARVTPSRVRGRRELRSRRGTTEAELAGERLRVVEPSSEKGENARLLK